MTRAEISCGPYTPAEQKAGYALLQRVDPKLAARGLEDPDTLEAWNDCIIAGICGPEDEG